MRRVASPGKEGVGLQGHSVTSTAVAWRRAAWRSPGVAWRRAAWRSPGVAWRRAEWRSPVRWLDVEGGGSSSVGVGVGVGVGVADGDADKRFERCEDPLVRDAERRCAEGPGGAAQIDQ